MEDNQTNEGQTNPPQVPPPPVEGNIGNGGSEPPSTSSGGANSQQPEREPIQVTVHIENPQNNDGTIANQIAGRANRLTVWSIAVNVVLMVATFLLFMLTKKATDAAVRSANAADSTYHEQRNNNSILLVRDSIKNHNDSINDAIASFKQDVKDSTNREKDSARFELERASTQTQIDAFREQSERFEIQNQPLLSLGEIYYFVDKSVPKIFYQIINKSQNTIWLETVSNRGIYIDNKPLSESDVKKIYDTLTNASKTYFYVNAGDSDFIQVLMDKSDSLNYYESQVSAGKMRCLLITKVVYKNPLNNQDKIFWGAATVGKEKGPMSIICNKNTSVRLHL